MPLDTLLRNPRLYQGQDLFNLEAVVAVHCDPETYPVFPPPCPDDRIHYAVGLHPSRYREFAAAKDTLANLLKNPAVCALGEIGIDQSLPLTHTDKKDQRDTLVELLKLRPPGLPIVVHCRGDRYDSSKYNDTTANCLCMDTIFSYLRGTSEDPKDVKVHVHCFTGDGDVLEAWKLKFPQVSFGFTGAVVRSFNARQKRALKSLPLSQLPLETDAPYLSPISSRVCSPMELREVARLVAKIRDTSKERILEATAANCRAFYGF
jgi:TatD DNase family protein